MCVLGQHGPIGALGEGRTVEAVGVYLIRHPRARCATVSDRESGRDGFRCHSCL